MNARIPTLVVLASLFFADAQAADWAQWRGPMRDGISKELGLLKEWPADGPKLAWRKDGLGKSYSTPAVVGDRIYLIGSEGTDDEIVVALDAANKGETLWTKRIGKFGNPNQRPSYPAARSTPTVDGDRLYVLGSDGDLACLSAADGAIVWQKNVREEFGGKPGEWAYAESPLIDGDTLVCSPGGSEATIVALNKQNGELIWKTPIEGEDAGYASVVPTEIDGVKQYVQFLSKGVVGVDAASGELLWRYDRTAEGSLANITTPVVHDGRVYTAAKSGGGQVVVSRDGDQWKTTEGYYDGKLPRSIGGSILVDGTLYGTNSDSLMAVDFATGEVKWRERSIAPASGCFAEGHLYLHGEGGEVALVEANPEEYVEKGRFTPPERPDSGGSKSWAYPVVADGKLYIFDFGTLYCYDVSGGG